MNKFDLLLSIILVLIGTILFMIKPNDKGNIANVYYDNKSILTIDLSDKEYRNYTVQGYNGNVVLEVVDSKIKVIEEISPKHLCSRQGYISNSGEAIICLPNKIVIEIENSEIDTIVR